MPIFPRGAGQMISWCFLRLGSMVSGRPKGDSVAATGAGTCFEVGLELFPSSRIRWGRPLTTGMSFIYQGASGPCLQVASCISCLRVIG